MTRPAQKRSGPIRLTLMGTVAAAALVACDEEPKPPPAFATIQECVDSGNQETDCQNSYESALKAHEETAPRFSSRDECLRGVDVDRCVETRVRNNDGSFSNVFMPLMAGYIVGNLLNRPQQQPQQQQPGYSGGSSSGGWSGSSTRGGAPIYRSRDYPSSYRDAGELRTSRSSTPGVSAPPRNVNTTTIARSGFGSTSHSMGGGSS
jgi:uncharacterized protein YgiB involved in biofilm formation